MTMTRDWPRSRRRTMSTADRPIRLADVLDEIKALDQAAGDDDRFFRYRVRQLVQTRRQLAERQLTDD